MYADQACTNLLQRQATVYMECKVTFTPAIKAGMKCSGRNLLFPAVDEIG